MARALTAARAAVSPERLDEYLATVGELAALLRGRGHHFWLFRRDGAVPVFLEFHEGPDAAALAAGPDERRLRARLRDLAAYDAEADALWHEMTPYTP